MSQPKLSSSSVGVQDVAPRPVAPPDLMNPQRYVRVGWSVILIGLVGFLLGQAWPPWTKAFLCLAR